MARTPSAIVSRTGNAVAEIRTGARNRNENGFSQAAGEKQQPGQFDDVQCQQRRRIGRFQPLHRVEGDLQNQIKQRGQRR